MRDISQIKVSIWAHPKGVRKDWQTVKPNVTLNGVTSLFEVPRSAKGLIIWDFLRLNISEQDRVRTEYYQIYGTYSMVGTMKNLGRWIFDDNDMTLAMNGMLSFCKMSIITKNLATPYDTNCFDYPVSQISSYADCIGWRKAGDDPQVDSEQKIRCRNMCSRHNCITLSSFVSTRIILNHSSNFVVYDSTIYSFTAIASLSQWLMVQQIVGLFTMFFDFAILDCKRIPSFLVKQIRNKLKKIFSLKKLLYRKKKRMRFMVKMCVYLGFYAHIYYSTSTYIKFDTMSESFLGQKSDHRTPHFRICPLKYEMPQISVQVSIRGDHSLPLIFVEGSKPCFELVIRQLNYTAANQYYIKFSVIGNGSILVNNDFDRYNPITYFDAISFPKNLMKFDTMFTTQKLLEAPYWTKCINEQSDIYDQHIKCLDGCLRAHLSDNRNIISNINLTATLSVDRCRTVCLKHVSLCYTSRMDFYSRSKIRVDDPEYQELWFLKSKQVLDIKMSPLQTITDFFTYTASSLGLWLGLSVINILEIFTCHKFKFKNYNYSVTILVIYTVCVIQISLLVKAYYEYEIVSKVIVGTPDTFILPRISILVDDHINESYSRGDLFTLSSAELEILYPTKGDITEAYVANPITRDLIKVDESILNTVILSHFYSKYKIVTVSFNDIDPSVYSVGVDHSQPVVCQLMFKSPKIRNISMHDSLEDLHSSDSGYVPIDLSMFIISGDIRETKLLPPPYSSKCSDYTVISPKISCSMAEHYSKYSKYPNNIALPISSNVSRVESNPDIWSKCTRLYGRVQKCNRVTYHQKKYYKHAQSNSLDTHVPSHKTGCILSPKTMFFDLFILVFDALGLWLGISFGLIIKKIRKSMEIKNYKEHNSLLVDISLSRFNEDI